MLLAGSPWCGICFLKMEENRHVSWLNETFLTGSRVRPRLAALFGEAVPPLGAWQEGVCQEGHPLSLHSLCSVRLTNVLFLLPDLGMSSPGHNVPAQ